MTATAAAAAKRLVLVTGANGGVGFELAAQLMAKGGYHVFVGSRSAAKGAAAMEALEARKLPGTAEFIELDVTQDDSINAAAATVERSYGRLDVLVNNAAIGAQQPPLRQQMRDSFDTNATGPAVMGEVFGPLLRKSTMAPRIVNIASGAGSIGRRLNKESPIYKVQEVQYRASKAALNMVAACQYVEFEPAGIKVFLFDPGFTQSNLSPLNTAANGAKPASEAVMPIIDIIEGKQDSNSGKLLHNTGEYPW